MRSRTVSAVGSDISDAILPSARNSTRLENDAAAAAYSDRVLFLADGRIASEMTEPTADLVLDRMKELGG